MKLLKLQATFGKLHDTLELTGGLDLITAPNEAGKSTWTAFLVAMFYGVDTSERAAKGSLPVKTKYKPWSGEAMQGTVELEWNGRRITIERRSTAKAPMSEFRAYETETGLPVDDLRAENCGEVLFGAKREVFLRSALLRQADLQVTKDAELDKKLASLVTSGDETASFFVAEKKLRDLRNHIIRAGSGVLPQCKERLAEAERELDAVHRVQQSCMELAASQKQLQTQKDDLEEALERIGYAEQVRKARRLQETKTKVETQEKKVASLKALTERLPDVPTIHLLTSRCREAENALHTAKLERIAIPAAPAKPAMPAWLDGKREEEAILEAKKTQETVRRLRETKKPGNAVLPIAAFCLALAGIALGVLVHPALFAICGVFAALGTVLLVRRSKQKKRYAANMKTAAALCDRYEVTSEEEIPETVAQQLDSLHEYELALQEHEQCTRDAQRCIEEKQAQIDDLLLQIQAFAPKTDSLSEAFEALREAERAHDACLAEERALVSAHEQLQSLQALVGQIPPETSGELEILEDEHEVRAAYQQTVRDLQNVTDQLNIGRGRLSAMPDAVMLGAEKEQLSERINALGKRAAAIALAQERISQANDSLQARFSPKLSKLAGSYFGELTGGAYDRLYLDREMNIQVTSADDPLQRPIQALSCGTADQLYMAVRLAMAELLLHPDCPLILDDALINFDDERTKRALKLLRRQSEQRQVILFSCHGREEAYLRAETEA